MGEKIGYSNSEEKFDNLPHIFKLQGIGTVKVYQQENKQYLVELVAVNPDTEVLVSGVERTNGDTLANFDTGNGEVVLKINGSNRTLSFKKKSPIFGQFSLKLE